MKGAPINFSVISMHASIGGKEERDAIQFLAHYSPEGQVIGWSGEYPLFLWQYT